MKPTLLVFVAMIAGVLMASTFWMGCDGHSVFSSDTEIIAGMKYRKFYLTSSGGLAVVNLTLDSLKVVELLNQKQKP